MSDHGITVNELILTFEAQGKSRTMFQDACLAHLRALAAANARIMEDGVSIRAYQQQIDDIAAQRTAEWKRANAAESERDALRERLERAVELLVEARASAVPTAWKRAWNEDVDAFLPQESANGN